MEIGEIKPNAPGFLVPGTLLVLLFDMTGCIMVVFNLETKKLRLRGGCIAQWKSVCLACTRACV